MKSGIRLFMIFISLCLLVSDCSLFGDCATCSLVTLVDGMETNRTPVYPIVMKILMKREMQIRL